MSRGGHETEIKLPARDVESAKQLLRGAGFRVHKRRRFEDNMVFDTPPLALRKASKLLRLRQAGGKAIVTYKGPPDVSRHKSRQELEVEVSDPVRWREIAEQLGFHQVFRYQKYRTEYRQPSRAGVATLDETPIGVYLELEGQPEWIDRTARRLGFSEKDYITASYGRLYMEWRQRRKRKPTDMVW
jgi:adenylate cyclase class 2